MADYVFGANILENLTTGMYQDSKVIYREYIQNACDQIDKAEELGILCPRDATTQYPDLGQGAIDIWLDPEKRYIVIEDNATGIKASDFRRVLGNIADSDKVMGKDKGFRGIGRLCGLAYCKQLVFTSRWVGEDIVSIMVCNALKMREMINEANTKIQKHTALEVLNAMVQFETRPATDSDPAHFFRVELIDINDENEELFGGRDDDGIDQLTDYLSFVSPVPYDGNFIFRSNVYDHAKKLRVRIDEYDIRINGEQLFKKYKTHLKTGNGKDDVYDVVFKEFYSNDGALLAWMWFGQTNFKAAIKEEEISRGLRLRKENIQIGEEDTLRDLFTREASKRGNNYFIGEIFAVAPELIPNSQRTYFNENPERIEFEHKLRDYFNYTLYDIYYDGSETNALIKKINTYAEKVSEFEKKDAISSFLSDEEREREQEELNKKKKEAEAARTKLEKKKTSGRSPLSSQIVKRRINEIAPEVPTVVAKPNNLLVETPLNSAEEQRETSPYRGRKKFLVDSMFPGHNKNERKLLSDALEKIFAIIESTADRKTSEKIIKRIKEDLK
jgi:molecular chaperone HtpG